MAENHPDELELLSFVEAELDDGARQEVVEHLVACRACSEHIRRLEAGRDALRAAPPLELPGERRARIMAALPERTDRWRRLRPARRILVIAVPVAAAAALAGVFVLAGVRSGGGSENGDAAQAGGGGEAGAVSVERAADDGTTGEAAPSLAAPQGATFVRSVQGPAEEVVRVLGDAGISAEVDPGGVVVAEARARDLTTALESRPSGNVPVYVR